jgi:hypothetical protein
MERKTFNDLKSFDPSILGKYINEVLINWDKWRENYWGQVVLKPSTGKTIITLRDIAKYEYSKGTRLMIYTGKETLILEKSKFDRELLESWDNVNFRNKIGCEAIIKQFNVTSKEIVEGVLNDLKNQPTSFGFITCTLQWLEKNQEWFKEKFEEYDIVKKVIWVSDESGQEASSKASTTEYNNGSACDERIHKARRFKLYQNFKDYVYAIGLTADRKLEIMDETFGTDAYRVLNTLQPRGENWESVSQPKKTIWFDPRLPMNETFPMFLNYVIGENCILDKLDSESGKNIGEHIKRTGFFQLPTLASDNNLLDFKQAMIKMAMQPNWIGKHMVVTTNEKITGWKFMKGGVKELNTNEMKSYGYTSDTKIIEKVGDIMSPLYFIGVVQKFIYGTNIPSFCASMSWREYGMHYKDKNREAVYVTDTGIQYLCRVIRLLYKRDELVKKCDSKSQFMEYDYALNTCQNFLPRTQWWVAAERRLIEDFYTTENTNLIQEGLEWNH